MDDSISISSPSVSPSQPQTQAQAMNSTISAILDDPNDAAAAASSLFDWSDFLDFNLDETFDAFHFAGADQNQPQNHQREANPTSLPYDSEPLLTPPDDPRRVRKRDPRLVCSNFLAGRVPCACPELDEKLELEEVAVLGGPGKKRPRTVRISAGSNARCQVPGCEADISELKGYHKRHRVCLRCANASSVVFDGQSKRYCQQCGKFHVLPDFDEGKRSCRRKLERHNKRRRRPNNVKGIVEKEHQPMALAEDVSDDDDIGKDVTCLSSEVVEKEALLESNGQLSNHYSHGSQDIQNSSHVTFANSGETQIDGERENPISSHSPSYCDNKTSFSSLCPTGRISFKLYDWNPAEFPRRLRHQIFQWLASMPVELEGYIRPGCTILTVFIAMPRFMWVKLSEEPVLSLRDLVSSPGNLLSGRDTFFVYLDDMIFHMIKDGNSAIKLKVNDLAPKLHYVSPTFFEAGKPMEFVACGSNLLQPKLRFLVSFSGKYLPLDVYVSSPCGNTEGDVGALNCQLLKISVPQTEPNLFGPAFVEVENESGLSNFIPVLIGDKEICREMKIMQQRFDASSCCKGSQLSPTSSSLEVSVLTQTEFSQFIMDVAWSLKKPVLETMQMLTSAQIRRFNNLLNFLTQNESTVILDRVLYYVNALTDNNFFAADIAPTDMELFRTNFDKARDVLYQKLQGKGHSVNYPRKAVLGECTLHRSSLNHIPSDEAFNHQDMKVIDEPKLEARVSLPSVEGGTTAPFMTGEVIMSLTVGERPTKSCSSLMTKTFFPSRTLVFIVAAATVCLGLCAVLLHPEKAGKVATTIRKCLLEDP